jgi:GTPase
MTFNKKKNRFILPQDLISWPPENDKYGNIEYKRKLLNLENQKINRIVTQLNWRMLQGLDLYNRYEAFYVLGIDDDGKYSKINKNEINISIDTLEKACVIINAVIYAITYINFKDGQIAVVLIRGDYERIKNRIIL